MNICACVHVCGAFGTCVVLVVYAIHVKYLLLCGSCVVPVVYVWFMCGTCSVYVVHVWYL